MRDGPRSHPWRCPLHRLVTSSTAIPNNGYCMCIGRAPLLRLGRGRTRPATDRFEEATMSMWTVATLVLLVGGVAPAALVAARGGPTDRLAGLAQLGMVGTLVLLLLAQAVG